MKKVLVTLTVFGAFTLASCGGPSLCDCVTMKSDADDKTKTACEKMKSDFETKFKAASEDDKNKMEEEVRACKK